MTDKVRLFQLNTLEELSRLAAPIGEHPSPLNVENKQIKNILYILYIVQYIHSFVIKLKEVLV